MEKYLDSKVIISGMVAAVGVVVLAMAVQALLPDTVPGAKLIKDVTAKAAS